jgi:hypothetical protein
MIPNTIKTGFDTDMGVPEHVSAVQKKLLAMVILLVKRAATTAAVFCRHQGIDEVDVDHIRKSLKYEGMRFFDSESLDEETANIQAKLEAWDEANLDHDDSIENVVNKVVDEAEEETETTHENISCDCDICQAFPVIEEQWDAYQPTDDAKRFLRDQIEFIDHTYALET